jgi:FO synthase
MGRDGIQAALNAGVNDMGGTLMNETITRAAGSEHGQELPPHAMESLIRGLGRTPVQRTTLYGTPPERQVQASFQAAPLADVVNNPARKYERDSDRQPLIRPGLEASGSD